MSKPTNQLPYLRVSGGAYLTFYDAASRYADAYDVENGTLVVFASEYDKVRTALAAAEQRAERAEATIARVRAVAEYVGRAAAGYALSEEAAAWLIDIADDLIDALDAPDAGVSSNR